MVRSGRERLLEAGAELFLARGYEATGVQAVLAAAEAPRGSFYHHFPSKESYAAAVVDRWFAAEGERLAKALGRADLAPRARVRAYFSELADLYESQEWRGGCMLGTLGQEVAARSELLRECLDQHFTSWRAELAAALEEAVGEDERASLGAGELAAFLIDAWEGATLQAKLSRSKRPLERFLEVFDELVPMGGQDGG